MFERRRVAGWILAAVSYVVACGGKMDVGGGNGEAGDGSTTGGAGGENGAGAGGQKPQASGGAGATDGAGRAGAGGAGSSGGGSAGRPAGAGGADAGSGGSAGMLAGVGGSAGTAPVLGGNGGDDSAMGGEGANDASGGDGTTPATCQCATSEALTLIDCGGGRGFGGFSSTYVSVDGSTVIYAPIDENNQIGLDLGIWTAAKGATIVRGYPLALSGDGQVMLLGKGSTYYYSDASGETPVTAELRQLSQDGLVAAGVASTSGSRQAVTWTLEGGVFGTGVGVSDAIVLAISGNGSVIGGQAIDLTDTTFQTRQPFVWSESTGEVLLGDPPSDGSPPNGLVTALSADGRYAAGVIHTSESTVRLFHYSEGSGMTDLGPCYSTEVFDCATNPFDAGLSFSDDGIVLAGAVGGENDPQAGQAFIYREEDGMRLLPTNDISTVRGISRDGVFVLGVILDGPYGTGTPFIWDWDTGVRRLPDALATAGVDTSGWTFDDASKLSKDGRFAIGNGTCGGERAIYRARLPE